MAEELYGCDFGIALSHMRAGTPMKRRAWNKKPVTKRKYSLQITKDGQRFDTQFLNYVSDRAVLMPEDLLANDWITAE